MRFNILYRLGSSICVSLHQVPTKQIISTSSIKVPKYATRSSSRTVSSYIGTYHSLYVDVFNSSTSKLHSSIGGSSHKSSLVISCEVLLIVLVEVVLLLLELHAANTRSTNIRKGKCFMA